MGTGLNILLVTPTWEGSLGFFCQRAFRKMGHCVTAFDYRRQALGAGYDEVRSTSPLRIARGKIGVALMNRSLRRAVAGAGVDLVFVIKGELIEPETVSYLAQRVHRAVALWYVDPSAWLKKRSFRRIAAGMERYDVTFVSDPANVPEALSPRIRREEYLTFACDPEFHRPVALKAHERSAYGSPVCFVGNWQGPGSPRESMVGALIDFPFAVWGRGWERSCHADALGPALRGPAKPEQMVKAYSASDIALNASYDKYLIFRNFEVPGCGPLLLTEDLPRLHHYFRPGKEVAVYSDLQDLRERVAYYLAHPDQARAIARRGQARAHGEHTFVHRMQQVLATVFGQ
jgi:spore maturation protein CgeB